MSESVAFVNIGGEFNLIRQFFTYEPHNSQVDCAVGDDAALLRIASGQQCVVSSDMLVAGRHFLHDAPPRDLGHKALAVNLSDLAAMGAEPIGFTLSLGLPSMDAAWLSEFSAGMMALARLHNCDLIGGDTTKSENLVINITVLGQTPSGAAIMRSGAQVDDDIWVSGSLGEAAYALELLQHNLPAPMRHRLERPAPRVAVGMALRGVASAMLDVSDGLAGDLLHILRASHKGAIIDCDALPLCADLPVENAWRLALTGGDDYELCFTAPAHAREVIQKIATSTQTPLTRIGQITAGEAKIEWRSANAPQMLDNMQQWRGYDHFVKG